MQAQLVVDCRNHHGEGILWNPADARLWWSDVEGRALWSFDPVSGKARSHDMPDRVACFAPRAQCGWIVAFTDRISLYDLGTGEETPLALFEPDDPETRLNDGRTDRAGRLVAGGWNDVSGAATSSVVCVDTDLSVKTLLSGIACANSTCFSADGRTMYFANSPDREIVAFDYDPATAELSNRRVHANLAQEPGFPDGACVDAEGGVWSAEWEGRRVIRVAPTGEIDRVIDIPVWKPTCCAFGGAALDTLYITTSRLFSEDDILKDEPTSGGLFAVKPGFHGLADRPFAG